MYNTSSSRVLPGQSTGKSPDKLEIDKIILLPNSDKLPPNIYFEPFFKILKKVIFLQATLSFQILSNHKLSMNMDSPRIIPPGCLCVKLKNC